MGNFYTNIVLHGTTQHTVVRVLRELGRNAYVSPDRHGNTVVYDLECETQDQRILGELAETLSRSLHVPAWAVLNHDDDILWYQLYLEGVQQDEYDSSPDYFDPEAEPSEPAGGDPSLLSNAFGVPEASGTVATILRESDFEEEGYVFAIDRHKDLAEALHIPFELVCLGFDDLNAGNPPVNLTLEQFMKVDAP